MTDAVKDYVKAHSKSRLASLLLTVIFGPFGLFYARPQAAIVLILIALVSIPTVVGPILCWIISIFMGDGGVVKHNKQVKATAKLSQSE